MCGNLGLLLLQAQNSAIVLELLRKMLKVTMVRGAQSAGLVTYSKERKGNVGVRARVVNGKREDLGRLLLAKLQRVMERRRGAGSSGVIQAPAIFQGHTRFATSSLTTLKGCHPHQWVSPTQHIYWSFDTSSHAYVKKTRNVESFITHNGDLDFFSFNGVPYDTEAVQRVLEHILRTTMPDTVDSACIAGLLDLLRTKGLWLASLRLGYLTGALRPCHIIEYIEQNPIIATEAVLQLEKVAKLMEAEWAKIVKEGPKQQSPSFECRRPPDSYVDEPPSPPPSPPSPPSPVGAAGAEETEAEVRQALQPALELRLSHVLYEHAQALGLSEVGDRENDIEVGTSQRSKCNLAIKRMVRASIDAFFDNDLATASRQLVGNSKGSFGLVLSHSLDAEHEIVVAARGQPMSVAIYPALGAVLFGSESAATKAALEMDATKPWWRPELQSELASSRTRSEAPPQPSFRIDLDDAEGELLLLRWSDAAARPTSFASSIAKPSRSYSKLWRAAASGAIPTGGLRSSDLVKTRLMEYDVDGVRRVLVGSSLTLAPAGAKSAPSVDLLRRSVKLSDNPLILPLPPSADDEVGQDLADIPRVLNEIARSFELSSRPHPRSPKAATKNVPKSTMHTPLATIPSGDFAQEIRDVPGKMQSRKARDNKRLSESLNQMAVRAFARKLGERFARTGARQGGGTVDLVIVGCEVSLWIGEAFAADMRQAFPKLRVAAISANKLLGLLGQRVHIPALGFALDDQCLDLRGAVVLLLSQSGGTFSTLACSRLLRALTTSLFAVCSEWDTPVARAVREAAARSGGGQDDRVFTTLTGFRAAEPCSLTVVAMHSLLTHVLLHSMTFLSAASANFQNDGDQSHVMTLSEVAAELTKGLPIHADSMVEIVGDHKNANRDTPTGQQLRKQGRLWGQHILEGPYSWILSAVYILVTVLTGFTPLSALVAALSPLPTSPSAARLALEYSRLTADAALYIFLPIWTTLLLRLCERRALLHRIAGRSLVIGDIPYVAQCLESYVSKLFALSYSYAPLAVYSANPVDHLVHRHTHRVVRGTLLAIGRPDGRVHALSSSENSVCLAIKQANSIQNLGVTAEAFTIGHNPCALSRTSHVVLPRSRPTFLSEALLEAQGHNPELPRSPMVLMGLMEQLVEASQDHQLQVLRTAIANVRRRQAEEAVDGTQSDAAAPRDLPGAQPKPKPKPARAFVGYKTCVAQIGVAAFSNGRVAQLEQLLEAQRLLSILYETRLASLERLLAFMVTFHTMGKAVQDFWPRVSLGILGYNMARSQSMMRIATTASPVSGGEVRERTHALESANPASPLFGPKT